MLAKWHREEMQKEMESSLKWDIRYRIYVGCPILIE